MMSVFLLILFTMCQLATVLLLKFMLSDWTHRNHATTGDSKDFMVRVYAPTSKCHILVSFLLIHPSKSSFDHPLEGF
jgi:hypothetical protein